MSLKLTKRTATQWQGNNLGTQSAEWTLASDPRWSIWSASTSWKAVHEDGRSLRGDTRAILLEKLERLLGEVA